MHEQYYTPEQLEQLAARREALGEEGMRKAQDDWAAADRRCRGRAREGHRSRRPARAGARGAGRLVEAFTGGDPGITASLKRMYDEQGAEHASRGVMSPGLADYVGKAMAARDR